MVMTSTANQGADSFAASWRFAFLPRFSASCQDFDQCRFRDSRAIVLTHRAASRSAAVKIVSLGQLELIRLRRGQAALATLRGSEPVDQVDESAADSSRLDLSASIPVAFHFVPALRSALRSSLRATLAARTLRYARPPPVAAALAARYACLRFAARYACTVAAAPF